MLFLEGTPINIIDLLMVFFMFQTQGFIMRFLLISAALVLSFFPVVGSAQQADQLSENLIRLRGEVEQLNSELELLREEQRVGLQNLNAQKADLDNQLKRQQLASRESAKKLAEQQQETAEAGVAGDELSPVLVESAEQLKRWIQSGLPFKTAERVGEVDKFITDLKTGAVPASRGVNRLWAFFEDEIRLTRDVAIHSQTVTVDGEAVLADVAKLGNMAMFYQTQDGKVGRAVKVGSTWSFEPVTDEAKLEQIAQLFDSLRKQIRQGFFTLPIAQGANG